MTPPTGNAGSCCVEMVKGVKARRVQVDEIWSFSYAKQENVARATKAPTAAGDTWTWTGIEADSKLIISYRVGGRSAAEAVPFMNDLRSRITHRIQLTSDGLKTYLVAVEE